MFTGIIEELGVVKDIRRQSRSILVEITGKKAIVDLVIGDSIAVDGVCLTVIEKTLNSFKAELVEETLKKSSLKDLKIGDKVNLERAVKAEGRFSGHFVLGHVDGVGLIRNWKNGEMEITYSQELSPYIVSKGSIAVDGVSLTVAEVKKGSFSVALIPHTAKMTTLGFKRVGDKVNLETDILGKYVRSKV